MAFDLTAANGNINSRHVSNVLAGVTAGLAMMAMSAGAASAATGDLQPLQSVDGVVSIELRADGSVLVALADGRVLLQHRRRQAPPGQGVAARQPHGARAHDHRIEIELGHTAGLTRGAAVGNRHVPRK